ncbi:hypothetical protein GCM10027294_21700 [Marinactinospora endophytica]
MPAPCTYPPADARPARRLAGRFLVVIYETSPIRVNTSGDLAQSTAMPRRAPAVPSVAKGRPVRDPDETALSPRAWA